MIKRSFRHWITFILLTSAIVSFSISIPMSVYSSTAISHPGGKIFEVAQAETFTLRYRLGWDEVGVDGFYSIGIYWDCPENRPYENFTVLYTHAYFDNDNDNLPDPGVDPIDNTIELERGPGIDGARWAFIVGNSTGDLRDGYFNVDIYMRAASGDGTPHIPTDNHPIWHTMDSFVIAESDIVFAPADVITTRIIGLGVNVFILPGEKSGLPGEVLEYTIVVLNNSDVSENYSLVVGDNFGWNLTLSSTSLRVNPGENKTAELSVSIPDNAAPFTKNIVRVAAIGAAAEGSGSCLVNVSPSWGVQVSISPNHMRGSPGETLIYTVAMRNTGKIVDNYSLAVSDNTNWNLSLSENLLMNVLPGENRSITLSVMIPHDAVEGDLTTISVSVVSAGDPTIVESAVCEAEVTEGEGLPPPSRYPSIFLIAISLAVVAAAILAAVYLLRKSRKVGQRGVLTEELSRSESSME